MCTVEKRGSVYILTLTGNDDHRLNPTLINSVSAALRRIRSESTTIPAAALSPPHRANSSPMVTISNGPNPTKNAFFSCPPSLSWSVDEKSLKDAFSSFGEVTEVRIMYDKETGRSRGFGFVNFLKGDEAGCAKDAMDGKAYLGRPLRISFALEKVRGGPVVVPRLNDSGIAAGRKN